MNGKFFFICRGGFINIRIINASVLTMINGKRVVSAGDAETVNNAIFYSFGHLYAIIFNSLNTLQYKKMMRAVKP